MEWPQFDFPSDLRLDAEGRRRVTLDWIRRFDG